MLLLFFDISGGELLVILAAVFIVFGPKKVPEIARQIGKGMNELKKATSDLTKEFQEGANQVKKEINQVKDTVEVSNQRMSNDFLSGPTEFQEDKKTAIEAPAEPSSEISPEKDADTDTTSSSVPRT